MNHVNSLIIVPTDKSLDKACEDLQAAVVNHHFGVMTTHDLKQTMATKGVEFDRECRIYEVCNPHQAKRVLEANIDISTALPCRISVYEEGGRVHYATVRPTAMLAMFGPDSPAAVAEEVESTMIAILNDAAAA